MGKLGSSPEKTLSSFKSAFKRDMPAAREPRDPYLNGNTVDISHDSGISHNIDDKMLKDVPLISVWKRIAPEFKAEHIEPEQKEGETEDSLNDTVKSQAKEIEDSLAMPPPATTEVPHSRLAQITHEARSTTTEITLDQAKDILLGKSHKSETTASYSSLSKNSSIETAATVTKVTPPVNLSSYPSAPWRSVYSNNTTATSPSSTSSTVTPSITKSGSNIIQYGSSTLAASDLDETPVKGDSAPTRERSVVDMSKGHLPQGSPPLFPLSDRVSAFTVGTTTSTTSVFREPLTSSRSEKVDSGRREGEPDDIPPQLRPKSATGGLSARSVRDGGMGYFVEESLEPADCGDTTPNQDRVDSVPIEHVYSSADKPKVTVLSRNRENILNSLFNTSNKNPITSEIGMKSETVISHNRTSSTQIDTGDQRQQQTPAVSNAQHLSTDSSAKTVRSSFALPTNPLHTTPRASPRRRVPTTPSSPAAMTARSQWEQTFKDQKLRKQQLLQMDLPQSSVKQSAKVIAEKDQMDGSMSVTSKSGVDVVATATDKSLVTGQSCGTELTSSIVSVEATNR